MKRLRLCAAATAAVGTLTCPVHAQQQPVRPPIAYYWMSVETAAGMGIAGLPAGLGGMMPSSMAGGKRMKLDLGSSRAANAEPSAAHAIPAALALRHRHDPRSLDAEDRTAEDLAAGGIDHRLHEAARFAGLDSVSVPDLAYSRELSSSQSVLTRERQLSSMTKILVYLEIA